MEEREGGRCRDSALPIGEREVEVESSPRTLVAPVVMERARVCEDGAGLPARLAWAWVLDVEVEADETSATAGGGVFEACD